MKIKQPRREARHPDRQLDCEAALRVRVFGILDTAMADEAFDERPEYAALVLEAAKAGWQCAEIFAASVV